VRPGPKQCFWYTNYTISITIPKEEYLVRVKTCKKNLHARIICSKGATPLIVVAEKLKPLWKKHGIWGMPSLEKGFYEFSFFFFLGGCKKCQICRLMELEPRFVEAIFLDKGFQSYQ